MYGRTVSCAGMSNLNDTLAAAENSVSVGKACATLSNVPVALGVCDGCDQNVRLRCRNTPWSMDAQSRTLSIVHQSVDGPWALCGPMKDRLRRWLIPMVINRIRRGTHDRADANGPCRGCATAVSFRAASRTSRRAGPLPSPAVHTAHRWRNLVEPRDV